MSALTDYYDAIVKAALAAEEAKELTDSELMELITIKVYSRLESSSVEEALLDELMDRFATRSAVYEHAPWFEELTRPGFEDLRRRARRRLGMCAICGAAGCILDLDSEPGLEVVVHRDGSIDEIRPISR